MRSLRRVAAGLAAVVALGVAGAVVVPRAKAAPHTEAAPVAQAAPVAPAGLPIIDPYSKVLVIMEENSEYHDVINSPRTPYLSKLAAEYGSATALDAGYPTACKSLAAYLLLTSGQRGDVCDDGLPAAHPQSADSIFGQLERAHRSWRTYAESAPGTCVLENHPPFAARHTPVAYYPDVRAQCAQWDVPMGTMAAGAFHDDLTRGTLPDYSMLVPNLCHDMHGDKKVCSGDRIATGDAWLAGVLPTVFASPDFQQHRLVVLIQWDEGSKLSNHIPTLVISPTTRQVSVSAPMTQCSMLALVQDVLALPRLGCAVTQPRWMAAFHLGL